MPTTITSYVTFLANTKAKASEMNSNLSNHRGTLVPIDESTATASNLTHNIGTDEHRWNIGYFGSVDIDGFTSTVDAVMQAVDATTGGFELLFGSSTIGSWDATGYNRLTLATPVITTTGSVVGHWALKTITIASTGSLQTTTTYSITSLSIVTSGRPVRFDFLDMSTGFTGSSSTQNPKYNIIGQREVAGTSGAVEVFNKQFQYKNAGGIEIFQVPVGYSFIDNSCPAGTISYYFYIQGDAGVNDQTSAAYMVGTMFAQEL